MSDETYIAIFDIPTSQGSRVGIQEDEEPPAMTKKQRAMKKVMYAVFFKGTGLVNAIKIDGQKTVIATGYTEKCLPEMFNGVPEKEIRLHYENASSHKAALTLQVLTGKNIKEIEHPLYSPGLAMCYFWLFYGLKRHLQSRGFSSEEEIDTAVHDYLEDVPREDDWQLLSN